MSGNGTFVKLQAASVPGWTIAKAATRMHELGIPVGQSNLVRAAIAAFIGLDEIKIREIALGSRRGPRNGNPVKSLDDFLDTLGTEEVDA